MNNQLIEIILTMVQNWKWILFAFMSYKIIKFGFQTYLQIIQIKYSNKDTFSVSVSTTHREISMTTSHKVDLNQVKEALSSTENNIAQLEYDKKKAS